MPIFQLSDTILKELSLSLCNCRFGSKSFDVVISYLINNHWGENPFGISHNVAFNDLGSNIRNECLLGYRW